MVVIRKEKPTSRVKVAENCGLAGESEEFV